MDNDRNKHNDAMAAMPIKLGNSFVHGVLFAALTAGASPLLAHEPAAKAATVASAVSPSASGAAVAVDAFHAALRRGDASAAAALLADDVLIFESGEVERSKAEYAAHHLGADAEFSRAVPSSPSRRAGDASGAMAWIASEGRTTGTFHGRPIDQMTTETMVLRRAAHGWKIVQIHWSSTAAR